MKNRGFVILKALGVGLVLLLSMSCGSGQVPQEKEVERLPVKASPKKETKIVRTVMAVQPEEMYFQFTDQYKINPDNRIVRSFLWTSPKRQPTRMGII